MSVMVWSRSKNRFDRLFPGTCMSIAMSVIYGMFSLKTRWSAITIASPVHEKHNYPPHRNAYNLNSKGTIL
eukprot:1873183-Amphidinium_carterae.1